MLHSIAVFCGSSRGHSPEFATQARMLGKTLAMQGIEVVYGGARVGLMLEVAAGALDAGGRVTGVMPRFLAEKEIAHPGLTELILVDSMHERKMAMNDRCDGVIALPGGFGTLDEVFEMITWAQLGIHLKPIGFLNVQGFYDHLSAHVDTMVEQGFVKAIHRDMLIITDDIASLLQRMQNYEPQTVGKWIH
jgi:uncharacterized protein (TIGR00730 family)